MVAVAPAVTVPSVQVTVPDEPDDEPAGAGERSAGGRDAGRQGVGDHDVGRVARPVVRDAQRVDERVADRQGVGDRAPPTLTKATLLIATPATGSMTWLKPALLFERSGSPVFELTVAASAIVCPAVPGASVPLIVIVAVVFAAIVPSVHTRVPPGPAAARTPRRSRRSP